MPRSRGVQAHGASGLNVWVPVQDETGAVGALMQRRLGGCAGSALPSGGRPPAIRVTTATLTGHEAERLAADLSEVLAPSGFSRSG